MTQILGYVVVAGLALTSCNVQAKPASRQRSTTTALSADRQAPDRIDPAAVRTRATGLVARIQRADYAGRRDDLRRLHAEMADLPRAGTLAARLDYWQGFALWRRAINGFNDGAERADLAADLADAIREFERASAADPGFVDARIGLVGCVGLTMFMSRDDPQRLQELVATWVPIVKELQAADPDNPRLIWVLGPSTWNAPATVPAAERQAAAMASYERGLALVRQQAQTAASRDPLDPTWGEPELLMSLAWSELNRETPDVAAAERHAQAALALVPDWHYVRDILLPQIARARR